MMFRPSTQVPTAVVPPALSKAFLAACFVTAFTASSATWAQSAPQPSASTTPTPPSATASSINPLTGQALSSEALARELARLKIEAELSETRVKLAKSQADLALATLRQEAEETRLKSEMRSSTGTPTLGNLPAGLVQPTSGARTSANSSQATSPNSLPLVPNLSAATLMGSPAGLSGNQSIQSPSQAPRPAQGHIQIGHERIDVAQSAGQRAISTVQAVDTQSRAPQQLMGGNNAGLSQLGMPRLNAGQPTAMPALNATPTGIPVSGSAPAAPVEIPPLSLE